MARMAELDAQGVTDLHSYSVGYQDATNRAVKKLEKVLEHDEIESACVLCALVKALKEAQ